MNTRTRLRGLAIFVLFGTLTACSSITDFDRFREGRDGSVDAGTLDAGDASRPDTGPCTPSPEVCNGEDDDCDGMIDEGLTDDDPLNCGSCGNVCEERASATPACSGGACVNHCDPGFGDCDGDYDTGCETDLAHPDTCGTCGTVCAAGEVCSATAGCVTECPAGEEICGRSCVDTDTSLRHCGGCDAPCADLPNSSAICSSGTCEYTCNDGWDDCDGVPGNGCEADLTTLSDCGSCSNACDFDHGLSACTDRACALVGCNDGYWDCNGVESDGCEADLASPTTCGDCATACTAPANASTTCSAGSCAYACDPGYDNCNGGWSDGCEASLSSPSTCGSCTTTCSGSTPVCSASGCVTGCAAGEALCSGTCTITATDPSNCGTCGTVCIDRANSSPTCSSSTCGISCDTGYQDCNGILTDGCEVNIRTLANCGSCGTTCGFANATASCTTGTCTFVACSSTWRNCNGNLADGCEVNTANDVLHCGACDRPCTVTNGTAACSAGSCIRVCSSGYDDCDGDISTCELLATFYRDADGDGYGDSDVSVTACARPTGYVSTGGDCDDSNSAIHPEAVETCNGIDDNCDGVVDNGPPERCNDLDDDCDGLIDEDLYTTRSRTIADTARFRGVVGQPSVAFDGTNFGVATVAQQAGGASGIEQIFFSTVPGNLSSGTITTAQITSDANRKDGVTILRAGSRWFVAYQDMYATVVRYAFFTSGGAAPGWSMLRVPSTGEARTYAAFVDASERVNIVYSDGASLRLGRIDGATGTLTEVALTVGAETGAITDLAIAPVGSDAGVLEGRSGSVVYRRYSSGGSLVASSGDLTGSENFARSYYFNLDLVYSAGNDVAVALVPTINAGGAVSIRYASFSGNGVGLDSGVEIGGTYAYGMAQSPVTDSYMMGISSSFRRYTYSHVSIPPGLGAGSINTPLRMIGGTFGQFRFVKTNQGGTDSVEIHGVGCTP